MNDGFSGKEIASQLGQRWKKVNNAEKKKYGLKAKFIKAVNSEPEVLERTSTVHKAKVPVSDPTVSERRKSV